MRLSSGEIILWITVPVLFYIYPAICFQRIARKSQTEPSWLAWIPLANLYLICRLARTPWWWILLCFIPLVGAFFCLMMLSRVPRVLGVTGLERFFIIVPLVNFVYLGYLAFRQETTLPSNVSIGYKLPS